MPGQLPAVRAEREHVGDDAAQHERLRWVAESVDQPVAPRAAAGDVAHERQPPGSGLVVPVEQRGRVVRATVGVVGALHRGQPDLRRPHQVLQHRRQRLLRAVPRQHLQAGGARPAVLAGRQSLRDLQQCAGVVQVVVHQQRGDLVAAAVPLVAGDPQGGRRMEVDAIGRRQPVGIASGQPVVVAGVPRPRLPGGVAVGPGERAAEALHRLVAGGEGHLGDALPLAQLPRGALQLHPAAQRDRRLPRAPGHLAAEVPGRGERVPGHLGQRVGVLVQHRVEQLAEPVAPAGRSCLCHTRQSVARHRRSARPFLLGSPSGPR